MNAIKRKCISILGVICLYLLFYAVLFDWSDKYIFSFKETVIFLNPKFIYKAYGQLMFYGYDSYKKNSSMSYQEFYTTYFEPDYKRSAKKRTYDNRVSSMRIHFAYFYKRKLNEISPPMIKKWQNKLSEKYSSAYIRNIYGLFQMSLDLAMKLGLLQKNVAKQVGNVKKEC